MLILLENESRILHEAVRTTLRDIVEVDPNTSEQSPIMPLDLKFCDFDGARFLVSIAPEDLTKLRVSLQMPCVGDLVELGVRDRLVEVYGSLLVSEAVPGYDFTLEIDLSNVSEDFEQLANKLAAFKHHAFGAPFHKYFKALKNNEKLPSGQITVSNDTTIYFVCGEERIVVIFSLHFTEKFDEVIGRVFLQAFADKRAAPGHAPVVSFDVMPPNELQKEFGIVDPKGNLGFVSMAIMPLHVQTEEKIENAAALLQSFRNYVLYHIKCSKSFFHSQMRARVKTMLQVLNRAKTDPEEGAKKKKTASGRTFERK